MRRRLKERRRSRRWHAGIACWIKLMRETNPQRLHNSSSKRPLERLDRPNLTRTLPQLPLLLSLSLQEHPQC